MRVKHSQKRTLTRGNYIMNTNKMQAGERGVK